MKRVFVIIGIILLIFGAVAVGAAIYFYNFHIFKEVRLCVGEKMNISLNVSCETNQDCVEHFENPSNSAENIEGTNFNVKKFPPFIQEKLKEISREAILCEEKCIIRKVKGFNFEGMDFQDLASCGEEEVEILIQIRGKEGLEIYNYIRGLEE